MSFINPIALVALLPTLILAQTTYSGGSWTMNSSIPTDTSGPNCVILAQVTPASGSEPAVIWGMQPICPTDPGPLSTVIWPISNNTASLGVNSNLAIYAQVTHKEDRTDAYMAQAGCILTATPVEVQYLLHQNTSTDVGRVLEWNNDKTLLWDWTSNGFISDASGTQLTCKMDASLLPADLVLPDPYLIKSDDPSWSVPIKIETYDIGEGPSISSSATLPAGVQTSAPPSSASSLTVVVPLPSSSSAATDAQPTSASSSVTGAPPAYTSPGSSLGTTIITTSDTTILAAVTTSAQTVIAIETTATDASGVPTSSGTTIIAAVETSSTSSQSLSMTTIGGGLAAQPSAVSSTSATLVAAITTTAGTSGTCPIVTVREIYTSVVTVTPTAAPTKKRSAHWRLK